MLEFSIEGNRNSQSDPLVPSSLRSPILSSIVFRHSVRLLDTITSTQAMSSMKSRSPLFLGMFSQRVGRYGIRSPEGEGITLIPIKSVPKFAPVSKEGIDLKERRWGELDESISFLQCPSSQIMASSNGFLLCCADVTTNMTYIVCNPVTKEFQIIPEPHKLYPSVDVGFVCKTKDTGTSLSETSFEIYRVRSEGQMTTLEIDTFSSTTGAWKEYFPVSLTPIRIQALSVPAVVLNDLIIWKNFTSMVVFNPARHESVEVIPLPEVSAGYVGISYQLGDSNGKIYYGRTNLLEFEVWMLEDMQRGEWTLKHKVAVDEILRENADSVVTSTNNIYIRQFHPWDSQLILVSLRSIPYWYNYATGRLSAVAGCDTTIGSISFRYDWPFEPRSCDE